MAPAFFLAAFACSNLLQVPFRRPCRGTIAGTSRANGGLLGRAGSQLISEHFVSLDVGSTTVLKRGTTTTTVSSLVASFAIMTYVLAHQLKRPEFFMKHSLMFAD